VVLGTFGIAVYAEMAGRVAAVSGRPVFDVIRMRLGFGLGLIALVASTFVNVLTVAAELGGLAIVPEGRRCGRVDHLELRGNPPRVTALLTGDGLYPRRLPRGVRHLWRRVVGPERWGAQRGSNPLGGGRLAGRHGAAAQEGRGTRPRRSRAIPWEAVVELDPERVVVLANDVV
jgi:hypothetical protein